MKVVHRRDAGRLRAGLRVVVVRRIGGVPPSVKHIGVLGSSR